jgi:hypothetical protein
MRYRLLSGATDDLLQALSYYEEIRLGLGLEFLDDFELAMRNVVEFPLAWTAIAKNHRRCLFSHFPYAVIYHEEDDLILVSALMHLHKNPKDLDLQ